MKELIVVNLVTFLKENVKETQSITTSNNFSYPHETMPVLTQKITETIASVIESSIQSCVDSIETVKRQQITTNEQQEVIDGHSKQLTEQSDKITKEGARC
jgi:hypothetical protein